MSSSLHHNDVITQNFEFLQNFHQSMKKSLEAFLNYKKDKQTVQNKYNNINNGI